LEEYNMTERIIPAGGADVDDMIFQEDCWLTSDR
jgi:hypothetical protein